MWFCTPLDWLAPAILTQQIMPSGTWSLDWVSVRSDKKPWKCTLHKTRMCPSCNLALQCGLVEGLAHYLSIFLNSCVLHGPDMFIQQTLGIGHSSLGVLLVVLITRAFLFYWGLYPLFDYDLSGSIMWQSWHGLLLIYTHTFWPWQITVLAHKCLTGNLDFLKYSSVSPMPFMIHSSKITQ